MEHLICRLEHRRYVGDEFSIVDVYITMAGPGGFIGFEQTTLLP